MYKKPMEYNQPCQFKTAALIADAIARAREADAEYGAEYLRHCLVQMQRFHLAMARGPLPIKRVYQLGLNTGLYVSLCETLSAQELLKSCGGMDAWWNLYSVLLDTPEDNEKAAALVAVTIELLGYAPATQKELTL